MKWTFLDLSMSKQVFLEPCFSLHYLRHLVSLTIWIYTMCYLFLLMYILPSKVVNPGSALKVKIRNTRECVLMAYPLQYLALK